MNPLATSALGTAGNAALAPPDAPFWFVWLWHVFDQAGPLANFFGIAAPLVGVGGWVISLSVGIWAQRKLRKNKHLSQFIEKRLLESETRLAEQVLKLAEIQSAYDGLERRLAYQAVSEARLDRLKGNEASAQTRLQAWLDNEGPWVAELLLARGQWILTHATGEQRPAGLALVSRYADAAECLAPENADAVGLAIDLRKLLHAEAQRPVSVGDALRAFGEGWAPEFETDQVTTALSMLQTAKTHRLYDRTRLAAWLLDSAAPALERNLGLTSKQYLECAFWRAKLKLELDMPTEALALIAPVIDTQTASPMLGPRHPDSRRSLSLRASALHSLGEHEDAKRILETLLEEEPDPPGVVGEHPDAMHYAQLLADILVAEGNLEVALERMLRIVEARKSAPRYGPEHSETLRAQQQLIQILLALHRKEEAMEVVAAIEGAQVAYARQVGKSALLSHTQLLKAETLGTLGRYEEALVILEDLASDEELPFLSLMKTRLLRALVLANLSRGAEGVALLDTTIQEIDAYADGRYVQPYVAEYRRVRQAIRISMGESPEESA